MEQSNGGKLKLEVEEKMADLRTELERKKGTIKDYEKLMRHLGKKIPVEFENVDGESDIFEFAPITYEIYMKFMGIARVSTLIKEGKIDEIDEETLSVSFNCFVDVVENSYPSWGRKVCEQFVSNNFDGMMDVMEKIMPQTKKTDKDIKDLQAKLSNVGRKDGDQGKEETKPKEESKPDTATDKKPSAEQE